MGKKLVKEKSIIIFKFILVFLFVILAITVSLISMKENKEKNTEKPLENPKDKYIIEFTNIPADTVNKGAVYHYPVKTKIIKEEGLVNPTKLEQESTQNLGNNEINSTVYDNVNGETVAKITLKDAPTWLNLDPTTNILSGVAPIDVDVQSFKVVLEANYEGSTAEKTFYILIK